MMKARFIFITGGVVSSLGKGITAASIGLLLKSRGFSVINQKFDPYLNIDPGTMNPYQHGEVFVTEDGGETDLDLGHYERFTDVALHKYNSHTAGKVYLSILDHERAGDYCGATVQVIPHVTDEIKNRIMKTAEHTGSDIVITEIGGTVGDIESLPFLEAIRQMRSQLGRNNTLFAHLSYVPYIAAAGEIKTKPTQHTVKEMLSIGLQPDILICRMDRKMPADERRKIALFCNVEERAIVGSYDVDSIYECPEMLHDQGIDNIITEQLQLNVQQADLTAWKKIVHAIKNPKHTVKIAMVGKYVDLTESYKSLIEALKHAGIHTETDVQITFVDSENIEKNNGDVSMLKDMDAILVPGGFGSRGVEGKIAAVRYARENNVPYLGICLGMQCSVIEFARNVIGYKDANSSEMNPKTTHPVIDIMSDQKNIGNMGGTMRLGSYPCRLEENSKAFEVYHEKMIAERHRHRYEFNNAYIDDFTKHGMVATGRNPERDLVEIVEIHEHPWFIGVQFHPEYKSTVAKPHPLFVGFIKAALENSKK